MTQKLEIDIIELPKIIGKEKEQDNLLDWLYFLENPKSERVTEKMKENENLKEAVKKLDNLSEDEKMQRIADLRQKAIMDEKAIYEKGLEIGFLFFGFLLEILTVLILLYFLVAQIEHDLGAETVILSGERNKP